MNKSVQTYIFLTDWNSCFNFMEWTVAFLGLRLWMGTALDYYDDRISLKSSPSTHQSANLTSISQTYFTSNSFLLEQSDLREFCDCQIFCLSRTKKNIVYQVHCQRMSRNICRPPPNKCSQLYMTPIIVEQDHPTHLHDQPAHGRRWIAERNRLRSRQPRQPSKQRKVPSLLTPKHRLLYVVSVSRATRACVVL